ncbi:RING-H2 finger protein ATL8-like [Phalaenopsis equestris]|uniref:RING-H2 finger protein ATL8-like n=1 Tax=Phalaenopsis equestris TaxID=78828 RepID=UPI0009E52BE7|nr:RING-H2 finger protein ATL8-like [Phalaenopsis equestris]
MLPNRNVSNDFPEAPPSGWAPFHGATDFGKNMAIVFAALVLALALGFIAGALIRRNRRRNRAVALEKPSAAELVAPSLEAIPALVFSSGQGGTVARLADCAICLQEFADGDVVRMLPNCGHGFHVGCIDLWISSQQSCPTCRKSSLLLQFSMTEGV